MTIELIQTVAPLPQPIVRLESLLLQHPLHRNGKKRLARHHERSISRLAGDPTPPAGLLILGDSRMGKSWLLKDYAAAYPTITKQSVEQGAPGIPDGVRWSLEDGDYRPIVSCSVPSNGDLRAFVSAILGAFGYKAKDMWDTAAIIAKIIWYVEQMGTQMIFIDEGHNLFSRRDDQCTADVVEFVKQLLNDVPCEFVIAGLPELKGITRFAPQLKGRMAPPIRMRAYRWNTDAGLRSFVGLLRRFEKEFGLPEASNIDGFDFARRMYVASLDGRIGWVVKLLSAGLREAIEGGFSKLTLDLMGFVYSEFEYEDANDQEDVRTDQAAGDARVDKLPEPNFLDEAAFNSALKNRDASFIAPSLPAELNPFLCEPPHLSVIRAGLHQRLDIERQALARAMGAAGRATGLKPKAARNVTAFAGD
ncbi:MAG: hypothetical protein EOO76_07070 [Novosphingobium sp.]|nr:MAG: hypothetical protein EOO76_07070 [Novosphingobium sp.]